MIICDMLFFGFGFIVFEIMVLFDVVISIGFEVFMLFVVFNVYFSIGMVSGIIVFYVDGDNLYEFGYCYFGNE